MPTPSLLWGSRGRARSANQAGIGSEPIHCRPHEARRANLTGRAGQGFWTHHHTDRYGRNLWVTLSKIIYDS